MMRHYHRPPHHMTPVPGGITPADTDDAFDGDTTTPSPAPAPTPTSHRRIRHAQAGRRIVHRRVSSTRHIVDGRSQGLAPTESDTIDGTALPVGTGDDGMPAIIPPSAAPLLATLRAWSMHAVSGISAVWSRRPRYSYVLYLVVFVLMTLAATLAIQSSVYVEPSYAPDAQVDEATRAAQSSRGQLTVFVTQTWLTHRYQFLLNLLILAIVYAAVIALINRFWVATAVYGIVMAIYAVASKFKIQIRKEPILSADLNFLTGGNTGDILTFIPQDGLQQVRTAIAWLAVFLAACIALQFLDARRAFIPTYWRKPFAGPKHIAGNLTRLTAVLSTIVFLLSFTWTLSVPDSWSARMAASMGDRPQLWNGLGDATDNGPAMTFLRLAHTNAMDKPEGYDQKAMAQIAQRYAHEADTINATRSGNLTDSTVILILSESFSDPTRVPGVSFSEDPMPKIRAIKGATTSGYMLSTGYGGGTVNMEYQALTGLAMANYNPSLTIAYQQLVPQERWVATFNQMWNAKYGDTASQATHTFMDNMYFRARNYKKFGFSQFWTLNGEHKITGCSPIDRAWYVSDQCTYQQVLSRLNHGSDPSQFQQVVTMQNHMPYNDWYDDSQFKQADTSQALTDAEHADVQTYAKGVQHTDDATAELLTQLDQVDHPVTVVFYGDHLPGIYPTAYANPDNVLGMHESDYFIWSNAASPSHTAKLPDDAAQYTSSNYFMAQAAQHMNAKVSPYLAFLTAMHAQIPAMSIPAASGRGDGKPVYLNAEGEQVAPADLPTEAQHMLRDYRLIQYDLSVGKRYLKDTSFLTAR